MRDRDGNPGAVGDRTFGGDRLPADSTLSVRILAHCYMFIPAGVIALCFLYSSIITCNSETFCFVLISFIF